MTDLFSMSRVRTLAAIFAHATWEIQGGDFRRALAAEDGVPC